MRRREVIELLGVISLSRAARAQQALPVVGFLSSRSPDEAASVVTAFKEGLGQTGFYEGRNVRIEFRWAEGRYEALPSLARELSTSKSRLSSGERRSANSRLFNPAHSPSL